MTIPNNHNKSNKNHCSCNHHHHKHDLQTPFRKIFFKILISGFFLFAGLTLEKLNLTSYAIIFLSISIIISAFDIIKEIFANIKNFKFDIHFLMILVAIGAISIGAYFEAALLLFLFATAEEIEHYTLNKTQSEIDALSKKAPKTATKIKDGEFIIVPVEELQIEDMILIKAGEVFPIDGIIIEGNSEVDESNITGESIPVIKEVGSTVLSGSINLWGTLKVKTTKLASESFLQKIIKLIHHAQELKAPSEKFSDKFGEKYTLFVIGLTILMFAVWHYIFKIPAFYITNINNELIGSSTSAFYRAMTLLVVLSPCALAISIPSAILASIANAAKNGILFKGGAAVENFAKINLIAFDKTGTLTEGKMQVDSITTYPLGNEKLIEQIAYSLEKNSTHPIAKAIVVNAEQKNITLLDFKNIKEIAGKGLIAEFQDKPIILGKEKFVLENYTNQQSFDFFRQKELENNNLKSSINVWVLYDSIVGRISLTDTIRQGSHKLISYLQNKKIKTVMLTGDGENSAKIIAQKANISESDVYSDLKPEDKLTLIKSFKNKNYNVAMFGDGVNDAPALALADVSLAMGIRGSDVAMENSDIILMHEKIELVYHAYELSVLTKHVTKQNLIIALASVLIMAIASIFGIVPLTLAVITHEGSTVLVCLNSLRILTKKLKI